MKTRFWFLVVLAYGCGPSAKSTLPDPTPAPTPRPDFVNRVWKVSESNGMTPGQLVVFLSDGTLVFADSNSSSTPAFGTWRYDGRELTMVEEGVSYRVEILSLNDEGLRLRSHNPGGFVETRFVPAEEPLPLPTPRR
ncbi:MAG TPA: hypothetical protein VIA29_11570 [Thermoanaerobaculia bacterium]|jgi:hypothetical protein